MRTVATVLLAGGMVAGCLDRTPYDATGPDGAGGISVVPATLFLEPGGNLPLNAVVGATGGGAVRWETSDPRVVTVSEAGAVRAIAVGRAEVRAVNSRGIGRTVVTVVNQIGRAHV